MSNPFNILNNNTSNLMSIYKMLTSSNNPMQIFAQLAQQNPSLQPVVQMLQQGNDPQKIFTLMCQQRGVNPQEFLKNITGM